MNRRVTHLRFDVILSRYGILNEVRILFGVSDGIRDITRSSGMVQRIRFIYEKSHSKFGNDPVNLWKVVEGRCRAGGIPRRIY
jgi:hypothetical protein